MSENTNFPQQTYERFAVTSTDLAGWSANFASGVVDAFEHKRKTSA